MDFWSQLGIQVSEDVGLRWIYSANYGKLKEDTVDARVGIYQNRP